LIFLLTPFLARKASQPVPVVLAGKGFILKVHPEGFILKVHPEGFILKVHPEGFILKVHPEGFILSPPMADEGIQGIGNNKQPDANRTKKSGRINIIYDSTI